MLFLLNQMKSSCALHLFEVVGDRVGHKMDHMVKLKKTRDDAEDAVLRWAREMMNSSLSVFDLEESVYEAAYFLVVQLEVKMWGILNTIGQ